MEEIGKRSKRPSPPKQKDRREGGNTTFPPAKAWEELVEELLQLLHPSPSNEEEGFSRFSDIMSENRRELALLM